MNGQSSLSKLVKDAYAVIDNFLTAEALQKAKAICATQLPIWGFSDKTVGSTVSAADDNEIDSGHLCLILQSDCQFSNDCSEFADEFNAIDLQIRSYFNQKNIIPFQLERAKLNITFPNVKSTQESYNHKHIDAEQIYINDSFPAMWTALFYPEDSDGDFVIDINDELCRIEPKENRLVVFQSHLLHAGNNPRKYNRRYAFNFVYQCMGEL